MFKLAISFLVRILIFKLLASILGNGTKKLLMLNLEQVFLILLLETN